MTIVGEKSLRIIKKYKRDKIIKRFNSWAVTSLGIENLIGPFSYFIPKNRLGEPGWCRHMGNKSWVNIKDFQSAIVFARKHFGVSEPERGDWDLR